MLRAATLAAILLVCLIQTTSASNENQSGFRCSLYQAVGLKDLEYRCPSLSYGDTDKNYEAMEVCLCFYLHHSAVWGAMIPHSIRKLLSQINFPLYEFDGLVWKYLGEELDSKDLSSAAERMKESFQSRSDYEKLKTDCQRLMTRSGRYVNRLFKISSGSHIELIVAQHDKNFLTLLNAFTVCEHIVWAMIRQNDAKYKIRTGQEQQNGTSYSDTGS